MRINPRPSLHVLIGFVLGAVIFGASGAVAATVITSKQIKDSTIQSVDVKNGSLTGADIKDGTLTNADVGVYYVKVRLAEITAQSGGARLDQYGSGTYLVTFTRSVTNCAYTASYDGLGTLGGNGYVSATQHSSATVRIRIDASAGNDSSFSLVVAC